MPRQRWAAAATEGPPAGLASQSLADTGKNTRMSYATPGNTPAPRPAKAKEQPDHSLASIADTIEAIIIALILALTFRAFVVEAFVIPTGSMAPTLLGAHFDVICPQCGLEFAENADLSRQLRPHSLTGNQPTFVGFGKDPKRPNSFLPLEAGRGELVDSLSIVAPTERICPNCAYTIDVTELPGKPVERQGVAVATDPSGKPILRDPKTLVFKPERQTFPWASNGDRILVLKYLYNIIEPERWDVVVFKEPMEAADNYIKRLIGLPGETVEIIGGDVFINGQIARKPNHVQEEVWQLVYDNDHYPRDAGQLRETGMRWQNPWQPRENPAAWDISGPVIKYAAGQGDRAIVFGNPADPNVPNFYMYNILGYNANSAKLEDTDLVPVGDLHLETVWTPAEAGQTLSMTLGAGQNVFKIVWGADGKIALLRADAGQWQAVTPSGKAAAVERAAGAAYRVAMSNVDRRVQLWIDGDLVLEHDIPWSADAARDHATDPDTRRQIPQAAIALSGPGAGTLAHLKLERDLYYTPMHNMGRTGVKGKAVQLREDEFFALGDNATASHDSRTWDRVHESLYDLPLYGPDELDKQGYGRIPRRFMLGKAFFVYWPAGHRPTGGRLPDSVRFLDVPLVPNTGDMRFIR